MPEGTQTPAAGGYLTQQHVATLLLQPLQPASLFLASGVKIFDTAGGNNLRIPKLVGSTGASWVAEAANELAGIPPEIFMSRRPRARVAAALNDLVDH